ncbi:phosphoadenosine phosphosulfate reductase family protein [Burkholderia cepacia]|uniref:phosphoadenosine phosphosulfate reductase domain-containing protein n=1 Tax=Burkholderia cepacia TaxID=292 RepID=UPI000A78B906|nr:phosphoadenosine phosphosulfate reductase family protein [Burkholderia cepacia]
MTAKKPARHILSLSGGKDSAALAIYLRDRVPDMEYIFSDTRKELPETYEYLDRISSYLGKQVIHLNADLGFDHWYHMYGGMIPSNHRRWCTRALKLKPFEQHCGGVWLEDAGFEAGERVRITVEDKRLITTPM